jgi:formamidopyrimidine-DNA glycosylase
VPELPEVETVRAGLEHHVVGRTVAAAEVLNPRAVRRDLSGPDGFAAAMAGRTFLRAERRGKYLWLALGSCPPGGRPPVGTAAESDESVESGEALLAHLGMSGQLLVGDPDQPLSTHVRARFTFTDGGPDLRFTDQRTFGHLMMCSLSPGGMTPPVTPPIMEGASPPHSPPTGGRRKNRAAPRAATGVKDQWLLSASGPQPGPPSAVAGVKDQWLGSAGSAEPAAPHVVAGVRAAAMVGVRPGRWVPLPIVHIAPDPLEAAFDAKDFAARLARKKTQIKRALLDQSLISGVGNIYADEALWRAKLHWARPTETLRPAEVSRLLEAVRDVLTEALKAGGTSFDALYVNVNGESGYFDRSLNAYGREGEPCGRCATPIRRDAFMNRSSYSCPRCQRP